MVLLKAKPSPLSSRQALLTLSLTTSSPTLSLSSHSNNKEENAEDPFRLNITLRLEASTQPSRPITILASGTVLDPATLSQGSIGALQCISDPAKRISLGALRPNIRHPDPPPLDMRQREWLEFITIPASGSVVVAHDLPLSRIFQFESDVKKEDVKPGEEYSIGLNEGYVGTMWWCWGDLEGDLKEKRFSEWRKGWEGYNLGEVEKPGKDEEGWVVGENPEELWVENRTDGRVLIAFVE